MDSVQKTRLAMCSLGLYRGLLDDPAVDAFVQVLDTAHGGRLDAFLSAYGAFIGALAPGAGVLDFSRAVRERVRQTDNLFTRQAAARAVEPGVRAAAGHDLDVLSQALSLSPGEIKAAARAAFDSGEADALIRALPDFTTGGGFSVEEAQNFHAKNGCGVFACFGAFQWQRGVSGDSSLFGIAQPDPVHLSQLKGYEYERGQVLSNTADFLDGYSANNLLLYGDRGTGKSSTVKAVFNQFKGRGLRIIEVSKDCIVEFSRIIARIGTVPLKFIIFIDDLSFAEDDDNYAALKAVLEGGVAARPRNTVIYATSNRRHFVKESFAERDSDDVHAGDAMQEKLSLADRFGITVTFTSPDQKRYLEIVHALAADRGLSADPADLERGAVQWALRYNGRSPRTATQYVDWATGRIGRGLPLNDF